MIEEKLFSKGNYLHAKLSFLEAKMNEQKIAIQNASAPTPVGASRVGGNNFNFVVFFDLFFFLTIFEYKS